MLKCLVRMGFSPECVEKTCKKDSAVCIMFFNGIIIMVCSFVAMYIASGNMTEFGDRLEQAKSFGEDYTCFSVPQKKLGSDEAFGQPLSDMFIATFRLNYWTNVILVIGCIFSAFSGPVVVLRWVAIPYQAILGMLLHVASVVLVLLVSGAEATIDCADNLDVASLDPE